MYVLHACALPDAQYGIDIGMWAEDSALPVSSPSAAVRQVRDHPSPSPPTHSPTFSGAQRGLAERPRLSCFHPCSARPWIHPRWCASSLGAGPLRLRLCCRGLCP